MATLTVDAVSSMDAARADVDSLGSAVRDLGADFDAASSDARNASLDFDALGEGSDDVASKSSQAAAGLGDLAGGLEAVGATGAATALNGVALASSVAAGAGDILNLVAETSVGRWIASTAASIAHRTATIAGAVATGVMTGAQAALNAVMAASPVFLLVAGIALLVGGVILAYKHSETFRNIVDAAFTRARAVVEDVVAVVQDVIAWFGRLPGEARDAWDKVSGAVGDAVDKAGRFFKGLIDDVKRLPREAVAVVSGAFADMFAPIQDAIEWVGDLVQKIKDIDFPDFPDVPFVGRLVNTGTTSAASGAIVDTTPPQVNITVNGAVDPVSTARQIASLLSDYADVTVTPDWAGVTA